MARMLLTGSNAGVQYFDIRPDEDHLVFRGNESEASSVLLKGTLVLCTTEPLKAHGISLRFTGEARTSLSYVTVAPGPRFIKQENEFFRHDWQFDVPNSGKANLIPAGNHEWPFELVLPGGLSESIEGCYNSWVVYRMKAVVDRGRFARNLEARHHIRLIRTFDSSSLELVHAMSLHNVWPEKISYTLSTPQKGVVFGSNVHVDFELAPLLKGLRIGKILSAVVETLHITVEPKGETSRTREYVREVATDEYELPDDLETEDVNGAEGYIFSRQIQLPHSLQACIQTVNEKNIVAKHQLRFTIALHNPDGHLSELRAHLPIHIFISPNMRINEQNELDLAGPDSAVVLNLSVTPPSYGEHQLDMLYTEVDPRTFITPGTSQMPSRDHSRRGSSEDIEGLTAAAAAANDEVSANTLQNRLTRLQNQPGQNANFLGPRSAHARVNSESGPSTQGPFGDHHLQGMNNHLEAVPTSRSPSITEPQHIEFNTEALARVPSYNTALHTSKRTPITADLPDYTTATSRPPTPPSPAEESGSGQASVHSDNEPNHSERHAHFADSTDDHAEERRRTTLGLSLRPIRRQSASS